MEKVITLLRSGDERLRLENEHLCLENNQKRAGIAEPETLVRRLTEAITLLKNGHNGKTGSTSPSHDTGRSNGTSLRGKSDKKSGGQPGHKGHGLFTGEIPDEEKEHGVSLLFGVWNEFESGYRRSVEPSPGRRNSRYSAPLRGTSEYFPSVGFSPADVCVSSSPTRIPCPCRRVAWIIYREI